jgi:hypothetical protein
MSYNKRVTEKIRSLRRPLIIGTTRMGWNLGQLAGFGKILRVEDFGGIFGEGEHT